MDDHSQMNRITFSNGKALAKRLTAFILCLILLSAQAAFPAAAAEPGRTETSAASTAKMSKETSPAETDSAEASSAGITPAGALALSLGIAIQNFPEGAIISLPLRAEGLKDSRAFLYGVLSGIVEPAGGFLTILAVGYVTPFLPYFLSFAAGAMLYVVVEELIPEMGRGEHSHIGTLSFAAGFSLMMVLDVAL